MSDSFNAAVPAIVPYLKWAEECAIDTAAALTHAGIDPGLLTDNRNRIPHTQMEQLILYLTKQSKDPLFGLHTAKFVQPSSYNVLGYIAMNSSTVRDALEKIAPYEKLVGDMGVTSYEMEADETLVKWHCQFSDPQVRKQSIENVLASWFTYTCWITDRYDFHPLATYFEHALEDESLRPQYEEMFGKQLNFNAGFSGFRVNEMILQHPIRQSDPSLLATLEHHATELLVSIDQAPSFTDQVRRLIKIALTEASPRKDNIAEQLGVTARTLQRKLQKENTSYQEILDELRKESALQLLKNNDLSLPDIAQQLGFSEPRSFHRSFKAWTGLTPGQYKNQQDTDSDLK